MIKLVAFDLWKTLAYLESPSVRTLIVERMGLSLEKEEVAQIFEETLEMKKWYSKFDAYSFFCTKLGLEPSMENVTKLQKIRDDAEASVKLYPHVLPMLLQLRQRKIRTGLVSNSSTFAIEQLKKHTELMKYVDFSVFSYELGVLKPNVRPFKLVLEKANCRPEEAIMVGDRHEFDLAPAEKIGMGTVLFRDYSQLKEDLGKLGVELQ